MNLGPLRFHTGGGIDVRFNVKSAFFDRAAVIGAMDKTTHKYLGFVGGRVRKDAQKSIKYRKDEAKASPKLTPPFTHKRFLPRDILYSFDATHRSVVVGPWRKPWLNVLHEYGGTTKATVGHRKGGKSYVMRARRYPPRPFMRPALLRVQPQLPAMWTQSVIATT